MDTIWVLFVFGFLLLLAEVFLPGMVAGAVGAVLILTGLVLTFTRHEVGAGLLAAALLGLLGMAAFAAWLRFFPRSFLGRRLTMGEAVAGRGGSQPDRSALNGARGLAVSPLRPAGVAKFGQQRVDVVTEGPWIESGSPVVVLRVEGVRVVVGRAPG